MDNQVKELLNDMKNQLENGETISGVCNDTEVMGDFTSQLQGVIDEIIDDGHHKCDECSCGYDGNEDHECCRDDSVYDDNFDPSKHFKLHLIAGTVIGEKLTVNDMGIINSYKNDLVEIFKTRDYLTNLISTLIPKLMDDSDEHIAFCETVYAHQFNYLSCTLGIKVEYDKDILTVPMLALSTCIDSLSFINYLIGDILDITVSTDNHSVVDGTDIYLFSKNGDYPSYKYDTLTGEMLKIPSIPMKPDDNVVMEETTDETTQSVEQ